MSITEEVVKALTAVVTPDLKALGEKVEAYHRETNLRFDALNQRFDDLLQRLALEKRVDNIERELEQKRTVQHDDAAKQ